MGVPVNFVGDLFGRGFARGVVELDAPILLRAAGVVRGGHDEPAVRFARADHRRRSGRGEVAVLADVHLLHAVPGGELDDDLRGFFVKPATVTSENHGAPVNFLLRKRQEKRLDPVSEVVAFGENRGFLAQTRGARLLALDGSSRDLLHLNARRHRRGEAHFLGSGSHALDASGDGRLLGESPTDRDAGPLCKSGCVHLASRTTRGVRLSRATNSEPPDTIGFYFGTLVLSNTIREAKTNATLSVRDRLEK